MARTLRFDRMLLFSTLLLVGMSVVMVYSASAVQAAAKYKEASHFLYKQLAWAVMGVGVMLVVMRIDYHQYRRPLLIWSLLAVTTALLVAVFFFAPINNTQRWLSFGIASIQIASIQPSELAKLSVLLFTAALLERRMHRVNDLRHVLVPIAIVTLSMAGLIMKEPDFGTASIIVFVVVAVLFAAGLSYRYLLGAALIFMPAATLLVLTSGYRRERLMTFLDPWSDPLGKGFQIIQALLAVGSGGVFGKGLMGGVQKLYYIPEPHTDFIYAVIGEELGLIGTTLTLACFALIAWRGMRASVLAPDRFGALLALGLTLMVALQALVNISVVTKLVPTKGIPLPFVSNGGSSLLISLVAMGVLLNISQQSSRAVAATVSNALGWADGGQEA